MTHEYRRIAPMAQTYPASNIRKMFNLGRVSFIDHSRTGTVET
ncbi:hypothetical protein [Brevibacterium aurantiacum]|nr:hypothetical protein [Brevibacterium aurantiacum]